MYKDSAEGWAISHLLKQEGAITSVYYSGGTVITSNVNATVTFYGYNQQKHQGNEGGVLAKIDCIQFPLNKMVESVVQVEHGGKKMVFMGGTDQKIYCYTR